MQPGGGLMCEKASDGCIERWRLLLPTLLISGVMSLAHVIAHGAVILQPDLKIEQIGVLADRQSPSQLTFGPDGRLYAAIANRFNVNATSVVSFAYNPKGNLTDQRVDASTGGALGIA